MEKETEIKQAMLDIEVILKKINCRMDVIPRWEIVIVPIKPNGEKTNDKGTASVK